MTWIIANTYSIMATSTQQQPTTTTAQKEEEQELIEQIKSIARRDASFLLIAAIAAIIFSWMELNAGNIEYRGINSDTRLLSSPNNSYQIIDAGYIATTPLYNFLKENRDWNDFFALVNTVVGVFAPFLYIAWQTFWIGDYVPAFKYLFISAMRSMCGWCTFLPPDPSYLMSFKDFPDIIQCLQKDCGDVETAQVNPFLSFFSGHVATLVMCANHMYVRKNKKMCYFFHVFNVLQIIRLLATRGHYSIDIVIGWFMATRVSNPAGRLGRYFSRGDSSSFESALPSSASEVFEKLVGVDVVKEQARMSVLMKTNEVQNLLSQMKDPSEVFAEPTARMLAEDMLDELRDMISSSLKKEEKKIS